MSRTPLVRPVAQNPPAPTLQPALRVAIGGTPYFGRRLAALLDGAGWRARYLETRRWQSVAALRALHAVRRADVLYQVGGQVARRSRPDALLAVVRRPTVMHWTGSDVLYARDVVARGRVSERLRARCTHLAGAPWLVDELRGLGIVAHWTPHSAVDAPSRLPPLPERFAVLSYLRPGREDFYGLNVLLRAARALPDVDFFVVGCERLPGATCQNLRCLGWQRDMAPVYARTHVLLRLAAHDGLSFMVQEALAFGRYAIWNHPFPGVIEAGDADEACRRLAMLVTRHRAGALPLNRAGAAHVRERYHPRRIRDELRAELMHAVAADRDRTASVPHAR